ncbi:MAG TPA: lipocalin-like domain-containing protein [Steroidobacteraceae bacterium]|nr:lipocalin-like domain-containing protein [Steroidobacteraceae bacterium]
MNARGSSIALGAGACAAVLIASLLIAACGTAATQGARTAGEGSASSLQAAPSALDVLRGGSSSGSSAEGFARALNVRRFEFPQDHGPHPQYRHEWWYFTGHLASPSGARFGFELTFFRVALAPPPGPADGRRLSHWRTSQIYVAHLAITDVQRQQFHSFERYARDALGLAGAQEAPPRVWLGDWSLTEGGPERTWSLQARDASYGLRLALRPLGRPVLNGDSGLSIKSDTPGSASYYYSIPRLQARGELTLAGRTVPVSGLAWLDREWGSGSLGPRQQGWDWFALQFADGSALMFYALRDQRGAHDPHSAGTWIASDGSTRALGDREVQIDIEDHWRSAHGDRYPSRWRVRVPSLALDVTAAPLVADQELETTPRYWEGDVEISGTRQGRAISGQGYIELVGYSTR